MGAFKYRKSTFKILKAYLKQRNLYDTHFLTPENVKVVKLGGDGKLNKCDVAFFRLKNTLKKF